MLFNRVIVMGLASSLVFAAATQSDQTWVRNAAQGGLMEVDLGNRAEKMATDPQVKQFAQRIVTDHSAVNKKLEALAAKKGIRLDATMGAPMVAMIEKIAMKTGKEFEVAYVASMVKDHVEDIKSFETASKTASDPEIRAFAAECLPTLREHLKQVQAIQHSMGSGNKMHSDKMSKMDQKP